MTGAARIPSPLVGEAESRSDREGGIGANLSDAGASTPLSTSPPSTSPPQGGGGPVAALERFSPSWERERAVPNASNTRAEALALLRRAFAQAGLDTPDLDACVLLTEALEADAVEIAARPHLPLGVETAARLGDFARRRLAREPVGRILGRREFWSLTFELSPDTLEPRPDTETVVEAALARVPDRETALRILDLGTGSGCLLVALLHELPRASGLGVDRSPGALACARRNAARNGVGERATFVASDWASALRGRFDLIVSNPPYIRTPDLAALAPEVREHDPSATLDGGADGLAPYRVLFAEAARFLAPGGTLVVEIGSSQGDAVRDLAATTGLRVVQVVRDLAGHPRAAVLARGEKHG